MQTVETTTLSPNAVLPSVPSWEEFEKANPHKPYEQSEKYGHYQQRVTDYYNNLYAEWLKMNK